MKDMRPDRDPRELAGLLHGAVPDGPDPAGRADQVVLRAKRTTRRRGAVSTLAVGVVAAAVVVGPHLLPSSPVANDASPSVQTPTTPVRVADPYACPDGGEASHASIPSSDHVPPGAVLARLCPLTGAGLISWTPPVDALTSNLQVVADAYNLLPTAEPLPCPHALRNTGFSLTFQYADGHLVRLSARSNGYGQCDFVSIDGRDELGRARAENVTHVFFDELRRQRAGRTPPTTVTEPTCPTKPLGGTPGIMPTGHALGLTKAVVCFYDMYDDPHIGVLSPARVRAINADFAARATRDLSALYCDGISIGHELIIGRTAWGDNVVLYRSCSAFGNQGHPEFAWTPSRQVRSMIVTAIGPLY